MRVKVRLFARLREVAGTDALDVEVPPGSSVETVWLALAAGKPGLAPHRTSVSAAVNDAYARMNAPVADGDEVAFLPPVSGG